MTDYNALKAICEKERRETGELFDRFLYPFVLDKDRIVDDFVKRIDQFKNVKVMIPEEGLNVLAAEYSCYRMFRKGGMINKYLKYAELKTWKTADLDYLNKFAANPWRFSFSGIKDNPAEHFYLMEDVFSSEEFLVYSPGITSRGKDAEISLWFNLLWYNGHCYLTSGAVIGFHGLDKGDISYYAKQLNPDLEYDDDIMGTVDMDPVAFLVLVSASQYPKMYLQDEEVKSVSSTFNLEDFEVSDIKKLEKQFHIQEDEDILQLTDRFLDQPHDAANGYLNSKTGELFLYAVSDVKYEGLVSSINKCGFDIPADPTNSFHFQFLEWMEKALNKKIDLNPFEERFLTVSSLTPEEAELVEKQNTLLELALPKVNEGEELDAAQLAGQVGLDFEYTERFLIKSFSAIPKFALKKRA